MNTLNEVSSTLNASEILSRQRKAFLKAEPPTLQQRKTSLAKLRAAVIEYRSELQVAASEDFGHRSYHETDVMELVGIVQSIDYLTRNLRRFMKPEKRHVSLFYRSASAHIEYQPKGVIGVMAPWNYPISLTLIPLATAIAAGNRAMLKPSELTPRTSEVISRMLAANFSIEEVNGGQTCVAPDYALVHEDDLEAFIEEYNATVSRFYPNGPDCDDYTSIVNERHYARLQDLLDSAKQNGARIIELGVKPESAKNRTRTLVPTLVVGAKDDDAIMREEIFGPILPVRTYRDIDEVINYINERDRSLALYYFGEKDADCKKLLRRTTSGNVGINNTLIHVAQDDLPFGGIGPSGMGAYHGIEGFRSMSHAKGVFDQGRWNFPSFLHAPFGKFMELALAITLGKKKAKS